MKEAEKLQQKVACACFSPAHQMLKDIDEVADHLEIDLLKAADPLNDRDYLKMEAKAVRKIQKAYKGASKKDLGKIKKAIKAIDPSKPSTIKKFVKVTNDVLETLPVKAAEEIAPVLEETTSDMYKATKKSQLGKMVDKGNLKRGHGLNPFGTRDEQVVEMLNKNNEIFINEGISTQIESFSARSHKLLEVGLEDGLSRKALTKQLNGAFGNTINNPHYWDIVGSSYMNRSRNWANLETFSEVGFEDYEILAILDERTSDVCKGLNGKRFSIKKQIQILEKASQSSDLGEFTSKLPWLSTRKGEDGIIEIGVKKPRSFKAVATLDNGVGELTGPREKLQRLGFAMPPFHGLCRTTVIEV